MSFLLGHTKHHAALHVEKMKKWSRVSFCNLDIALHHYIVYWTTELFIRKNHIMLAFPLKALLWDPGPHWEDHIVI